jgi:hypothetical protein
VTFLQQQHGTISKPIGHYHRHSVTDIQYVRAADVAIGPLPDEKQKARH